MPSVFVSYSHKDEVWKDRLSQQLEVLKRQGLLDFWDDRRIEAGEEWHEEIRTAIENASVAVLLISADFLSSNFIQDQEVPRLLRLRAQGDLRVIPVIVRSCAWKHVPWLSKLQARPLDGKPLKDFRGNWERELTKIAEEILDLSYGGSSELERNRAFREKRDDFLSRVETICRLRESGVEVERIRGEAPFEIYLQICKRPDDGIAEVYPVGAVEHGVSMEILDQFLIQIHGSYRTNDSGVVSVLVYGGPEAEESVAHRASKNRVRLRSFVEFQGLIDFRSYLRQQTRKLERDPIYPPALYVPQRMIDQSGRDTEATSNALATIQEWLSSPNGRFLVLLGDFGTGKTFLLHELARRVGEEGDGLVPILLQMRSLEKGRDLDSLLAQHFAQEGVEDFSPRRFRYMLEQGRIVLLFDGFDELALRVTYQRATEHFDTLLQAATGTAKVVVTSRRQHFLSDQQVKTVLAERAKSVVGHRLAILQPFNRDQIRIFLGKFCGNNQAAERRLQLIDRVKDLLGLSYIPRLLGFIAELPEKQLLEAEAGAGEITAARLYELLLQRWLEGEFERVHPKGAPPGLSVEDRWRGVTTLALRLWQKTDASVGLAELTEDAARVIEALRHASLDPEVAAFQLGSGTLLIRDEDGNFSFLHQSILEWLVARNAAEELRRALTPQSLTAREISPLMADFLGGLAGKQAVADWARFVLLHEASEAAKKNALLLLERLGERAREPVHLAGQDLRGKDLSYQDLRGANLTEADLAGARLIETRLDAARLRDAKLSEADLSGASLASADLSGADLTNARLMGTDLRGARLYGTALRRAKLLGSERDSAALVDCNSFGAALELPRCLEGQLVGPAWSCHALAWSRDGELLASAEGPTVQLYEVATGREIRRFQGHGARIWSIVVSPDGETLATGSFDGTTRLWELSSGREIQRLQGHDNGVSSVAFSPDGQALATASFDKTARLWEVNSGREIQRFLGHANRVWSVAFSPDGQALATAGYDKSVRLWEGSSGREIQRLRGHGHRFWSVAFSPDGKALATASDDTTARLWDVSSGREIRRFEGHGNRVWNVAFSPDGQALATASDDKTARLWEVATGRVIRRFQGHDNRVWSVAFSPNGQALATASNDKAVLHEVSSGREIRRFQGHDTWVWSIAFSPNGQALATASDESAQLWDVLSGREIRRFQGHRNRVWSLAFSLDGKVLATGSEDNSVGLWDVSSGRRIQRFQGHRSRVLSVALSPDGQTLATASDDNSARLWDVSSGCEIRRFQKHRNRVWSVAFSLDGIALTAGSEDKPLRLWEIATGREIQRFEGHRSTVRRVAFSPDGNSLATGSEDRTVRLWKIRSGRELQCYQGHTGSILSVVFSPDGQALATASADNTARLWDVSTGSEIRHFRGHSHWVMSVAFSPGGRVLASGSYDNTIRLWSVPSGACIAILAPLPEGWVAFSPDGRYKLGGIPAGGFWHVINLCRFEAGELDDWIPGLRLPDDASFFDLPPWKPEVRRPLSLRPKSTGEAELKGPEGAKA